MNSLFVYSGVCGFLLGVCSLFLYAPAFESSLFIVTIGCALLLLGLRKMSVPVLCTAIVISSFGIGLIRSGSFVWHQSPFVSYVDKKVTRTGIVVREPEQHESTQHLYVRDAEYSELLLVSTDAFLNVDYGDTVQLQGVLKEPKVFETDLGRTFNYPGYLHARGVSFVVSFADVRVQSHGDGNPLVASLIKGKHVFMGVLERYINEPEVGLGEGLLLGVKRALGEDLEEAFRRVGIIHIVVLSGFNIMIVAEAVMRILSFCMRPRARVFVGVAVLSLFAIMVGLSSTVVRASIMAIFVLIARVSGRTYGILRALVIAGCIMVFINPFLLLYDPGFQLSFLATLGLIFVAPHIERFLFFVPKTFQMRGFITATIATQIMVLPLLLYLMGQFSLVAVLVNVLVLPMVPFSMLLTFIVGLVGMLAPPLAVGVGFFAHLSLAYIIAIANVFSLFSFAAVTVPAFPFFVVILLYVGIVVILIHLSRVSKRIPLVGMRHISNLNGWTIVTVSLEKGSEGNDVHSEPFPFR